MILKYWKLLAGIGIVFISMTVTIWWLYDDVQDLTDELARESVARQLCSEDYIQLQDELDLLKLQVEDYKKANEEFEEKIERSREIIRQINNDRELLLQRLREEDIPDECNEIFKWMHDKAEEFNVE